MVAWCFNIYLCIYSYNLDKPSKSKKEKKRKNDAQKGESLVASQNLPQDSGYINPYERQQLSKNYSWYSNDNVSRYVETLKVKTNLFVSYIAGPGITFYGQKQNIKPNYYSQGRVMELGWICPYTRLSKLKMLGANLNFLGANRVLWSTKFAQTLPLDNLDISWGKNTKIPWPVLSGYIIIKSFQKRAILFHC